MVVGDILARTARLAPNREALVFGRTRLSYRAFDEAANRLANALRGLGVGAGERVAILLRNCHQYEIAVFGIAKAGGVAVPVNFRLNAEEIRFILTHAGARAVITSGEFLDLLDPVMPDLGDVKVWISVDGDRGRAASFDRVLAMASAAPPGVPVAEGDLAFIFYTSGTTGLPKGAMITHANMTISAMIGAIELRLRAGEIGLFSIPLFHGGGGSAPMGFFLMGATAVVAEYDPERVAALIEAERVTTATFVPAMILFLLDSPGRRRYDLGSMKRILDGAAPMPTDRLKEVIREWGIEFYNIYGLTETALFLSVLHPEDYAVDGPAEKVRRLGSVGREAVGIELRVIDDGGHEVATGGTGEIIARGRNITSGYWNAPEETARVLRGGWFHTGDVAMTDDEGYLYIVDRKKDIIISGGENISSVQVEEALYTHPAVREAAVIGIPDDRWGEAVRAIVVLREGMAANEAEVIEHCRARLASYKKPRAVDFVATLPRNPSGKVLKHVLREPFWRDRVRQV